MFAHTEPYSGEILTTRAARPAFKSSQYCCAKINGATALVRSGERLKPVGGRGPSAGGEDAIARLEIASGELEAEPATGARDEDALREARGGPSGRWPPAPAH